MSEHKEEPVPTPLEKLESIDMDVLKKHPSTAGIIKKAKFLTGKKMNEDGQKNKIYLFCITGGPCAGKTTCLQFLSERFTPQYKVYIIPELATMTVGAGVAIIPSEFTPDTHTVFTKGIMKAQMDLENYFYEIAKIQKEDVIIFTDRGMCDNLAYCSEETKERVFNETGWNTQKLTNQRYDAIFHLVTAADGAEEFYTTENNEARSEGVDLAKMLDKWTQNSWISHQSHFVIDNSIPGFNKKVERLYMLIANFLGISANMHYVKKYLIPSGFDTKKIPEEIKHASFYEEFDFLKCGEENKRMWVKKRTDPSGNNSYALITRTMSDKEEERIELKRKISAKIYNEYAWQKDPAMNTLKKDFVVFTCNNTNYMVETYTLEDEKITVARVSLDTKEQNENLKMPEWIGAAKDISENPKYMSYEIARKEKIAMSPKK